MTPRASPLCLAQHPCVVMIGLQTSRLHTCSTQMDICQLVTPPLTDQTVGTCTRYKKASGVTSKHKVKGLKCHTLPTLCKPSSSSSLHAAPRR